ncbi:hypothetical protein CMI47_12840 [Candidatus Pacearchaeota archaeon]|nr:hypothetical protein [Candidatus Pacearchaeota archaeon]|tara:strand:+ start:47589 stop:48332 length:744 start_codon:yes stop_codon:yes gene_type:complete
MSNNKIRRLAKANVLLLEEAKDSRNFVELFNRNFSKRINEHLTLVENIVSNIIHIKAYGDNMYSTLNENLSKQDIKNLVKEQLKVELKKRQNLKLLEKHTNYINELFGLFSILSNVLTLKEKSSIGIVNKTCTLMLESVKENDIKSTFSAYKKSVRLASSTSTQSLLSKMNSTTTSFSDLGVLAATSLKTIRENVKPEALEWWRNTLLLKESEFRTPKNILIKLQKILLETESKFEEFSKQIEDVRI